MYLAAHSFSMVNIGIAIMMLAIVIGYVLDSRKNPAYYGEALAFWLLLAAGGAVIYVFIYKLLEWPGISTFLFFLWAGWIGYRINSRAGKKREEP